MTQRFVLSERVGSRAGYKRISDYGVIGDMHSAALVGMDGSIDWYCTPRFDSPSVFAALLDSNKGGKFQLAPTGDFTTDQNYEGDTNVLTTTFETSDGRAKVTDFMPCFMDRGGLKVFQEVHRIVECEVGRVGVRIFFQPRLNYALDETVLSETAAGCLARGKRQSLNLRSSVKLEVTNKERLESEIHLSEGERASFVLGSRKNLTKQPTEQETRHILHKTLRYWRNWVRHIKYQGPYRNEVVRSCLVLKLLQFAPTGAMVAAVTTSLPECVGGERNWDYRYSWIRDAGFSIWALSAVGATREALDYAKWLLNLRRHSKVKLQAMTGIGGERHIPEYALDHLEGYRCSRPVRIGNAAHEQLQLDVYGILVDSLYFLHHTLGWTTKQVYENLVRYAADQAAADWQKSDSGTWEIREPRFLVESTMWCYIAMDRAVKMARELGYHEDQRRWGSLKRKVRQEILSKGWSSKKGAFTMEFGGDALDAANLLMPLVKFLPAKDPRMTSTIRHIQEELGHGDLLYRYRVDDGLPGKEGAFTVCSFWMVDCLTRLGKLKEAETLLNQLLKRANHVGLYSEEIDPETGEALGNFPQAYAHMGLINAVVRFEEAHRGGG